MKYRILYSKNYFGEVKKLPKGEEDKIKEFLSHLISNPQKIHPQVTRLRGYKDVYRKRFGKRRLIYKVSHREKTILVIGVNPRGKVYKVLESLLG